MAGFPLYTHIHCSARYEPSAQALEKDLDKWMKNSDIVTLTEVSNDKRAQKLQEEGWGYYNAKKDNGADDAGIAWNKDTWTCPWRAVRRLHTKTYIEVESGKVNTIFVHACSVTLKHNKTGRKLLISVARLPSGLAAAQGWNTLEQGWRARKAAYMECNSTWSQWVEQTRIENKVDGIMVVADWNLDLKMQWVQQYLAEVWGQQYVLTWRFFPTGGTSGHKMLAGTMARHLAIQQAEHGGTAELLEPISGTNHRPYTETLKFQPGEITADPTAGDVKIEYPAWWGFGDYIDDEIYTLERFAAGRPGGEVL